MQASATSPKSELPKCGQSITHLPFIFCCWLEQLTFLAAGHSRLRPEPCLTLMSTMLMTKLQKTSTANQQHPKTLAMQTTNYSTNALIAAYLFKYGWQLVVKLFCGACSWRLTT